MWNNHNKYICPDVNCSYGAPMGRGNAKLDEAEKHYLRKVPMQDGCYDAGGAYWGSSDYRAGIYPLYCCYTIPGETSELSRYYLRAKSRQHAKEILKEEYPDLKYYR